MGATAPTTGMRGEAVVPVRLHEVVARDGLGVDVVVAEGLDEALADERHRRRRRWCRRPSALSPRRNRPAGTQPAHRGPPSTSRDRPPPPYAGTEIDDHPDEKHDADHLEQTVSARVAIPGPVACQRAQNYAILERSMGEATRQDSPKARDALLPAGYSAGRHMFRTAVLASGIAFAAVWLATRASAVDWLLLPAFFVVANGIEWMVHKNPMHRPMPPRIMYKNHALIHHRAFLHDSMPISGTRESWGWS